MKTVLEKGYIFYQGKFQELEKMVIEKGKISEINITSTKAKKGKSAPAVKKKSDEISETIDCSGKYILPGFIDPHTHISLDQSGIGHFDSDSNEMFGLVTPQIRAYDAVKMRDIAFQNAIKGGVTTVMITPGSANPIGGQACVVKVKGTVVAVNNTEAIVDLGTKHTGYVALDDLTDESDNSHDWGFYLYSKIVGITRSPEFTIYYSDGFEIIMLWFPAFITRNFVSFKLNARGTIASDVSATKVREKILANDEMWLKDFVPTSVYDRRSILRQFIQAYG